jgi:hypothetical protein
MSITMGCIGKGTLTVAGPLSAGAALRGGGDAAGAFSSYYWSHVFWVRPGERIKLRLNHLPSRRDVGVLGLMQGQPHGSCHKVLARSAESWSTGANACPVLAVAFSALSSGRGSVAWPLRISGSIRRRRRLAADRARRRIRAQQPIG